MSNKIKYNLRNVYIAKLTTTVDPTTGATTYTYATPVALPGAVNLSLDAQGEASPFYADGVVYFRTVTNNGYSGDLEIALVPDWFREQILLETRDDNNVLVETSEVVDSAHFAMLFEFSGDDKAIRHVLYNCSVSQRPTLASQTKEDTITPVTETLTISADARADGLIKGRTSDTTDTTIYNTWFTMVYESGLEGTAQLASFTGLTLSPSFVAGTYTYTATVSSTSSTLTYTVGTGATGVMTVNGVTVASGSSVTWSEGDNPVIITVSAPRKRSSIYSITVTAS